MANIQSAKKKVRKDKKRTSQNESYRRSMKSIFKSKKTNKKTGDNILQQAYSIIDKAVKRRVIHKNKAARLKARVSKLHGSKK